MDILDDMGVSKLSAKGFFFFFYKVNYSFKTVSNTSMAASVFACVNAFVFVYLENYIYMQSSKFPPPGSLDRKI